MITKSNINPPITSASSMYRATIGDINNENKLLLAGYIRINWDQLMPMDLFGIVQTYFGGHDLYLFESGGKGLFPNYVIFFDPYPLWSEHVSPSFQPPVSLSKGS